MERPRGSVMGAVLASRLEFLRSEGGDPLIATVVAKLADADRAVLDAGLTAEVWYSFDLGAALDLAIGEVMGKGNAIFRTLGAYSASHNLGAAHKVFVTDKNPQGLLEQAAHIYRLYYDSGDREYTKLSPTSAALRTYDSRSFSIEDCLTVVGWHEKAIELCGGKNPRVSEPICRARGGPLCEYLCEWD